MDPSVQVAQDLRWQVKRVFAAALACSNGKITPDKLMDIAVETSNTSADLLDSKVTPVEGLSVSDIRRIFPMLFYAATAKPWMKTKVVVYIPEYIKEHFGYVRNPPEKVAELSRLALLFGYVIDQESSRGLYLRAKPELRYSSKNQTVFGSPDYTLCSGPVNDQIQHLVLLDNLGLKHGKKTKQMHIVTFMAMMQQNLKERGKGCRTVYGLLASSDAFFFYRLDSKGALTTSFHFLIDPSHLQKAVNLLAYITNEASATASREGLADETGFVESDRIDKY